MNISAIWLEFQGEGDEVLDAEPFGTEVEDTGGKEFRQFFIAPSVLFRHCRDERLQGISQSLAPLVERSLHYGFEKAFIAAEILPGIAPQAYDCRFDFGRRVERALTDSEQIFYVVPSLQQTVCRTLWSRASRLSSQPLLSVSCTLPAEYAPCGPES